MGNPVDRIISTHPHLLQPPYLIFAPLQSVLHILKIPLTISQLHGKARAFLLALG